MGRDRVWIAPAICNLREDGKGKERNRIYNKAGLPHGRGVTIIIIIIIIIIIVLFFYSRMEESPKSINNFFPFLLLNGLLPSDSIWETQMDFSSSSSSFPCWKEKKMEREEEEDADV